MIVNQRIHDGSNGKTTKPSTERPFTELGATSIIKIGGKTIKVELARSPQEKEVGLSGRQSLPPDQGLLFIFDKPRYYPFWMKDMKFPIDIVWLDKNGFVIDITKNLQPSSFPQRVTSKSPSQFVLELNANFTEQNNIKIGDKLINN
jgi:hypothetical protein